MIQNQTTRKMKMFRSENGLEICSNEFNNLCFEDGIARHRTVAHIQQQNVLAGKMTRTILEGVRYVLLFSGMPKSFRAEVAHTSVYLINRCTSSAIYF